MHNDVESVDYQPQTKETIIGTGIVGAMEAYYAYKTASHKGERVKIRMYEKNEAINDTTVMHLVPSLTPDEIIGVIPAPSEFKEKSERSHRLPHGIRVDDVAAILHSPTGEQFKRSVEQFGQHPHEIDARAKTLLSMGKESMKLWQALYETADEKLKQILRESNFNPCHEPSDLNEQKRYDGYRIDLIDNYPGAINKANTMKADYETLGYHHCEILSPQKTKALDPALATFCTNNSIMDDMSGEWVWRDQTCALWRPGGCIDTHTFLPKFYQYLQEVMGTYVNAEGRSKDCFKLYLGRKADEVTYQSITDSQSANVTNQSEPTINGLGFFDKTKKVHRIKQNKYPYKQANYVFCPGEAIGTLNDFGFKEPPSARFAGVSLKLTIPIPADKKADYENVNQYMELHQDGFSLAWQAKYNKNRTGDTLIMGVGGTKAFYANIVPDKNDSFGTEKNLLQLNVMNQILPSYISLALKRNTTEQALSIEDLNELEQQFIAERWIGSRAVAYDGFPSIGPLYRIQTQTKISNARCTTHLSSGGVSFSPIAVLMSRGLFNKNSDQTRLQDEALQYGNTRRGGPGL